jgi:hypothetical protein
MTSPTPVSDHETLAALVEEPVEVAIDTEFNGAHTLCIQAACRVEPDTLAVQLYRSPQIPELPADFDVRRYVSPRRAAYGRFFNGLELRPVGLITPDLSPVRLLKDLFQLPDLSPCTCDEAQRLWDSWSAIEGPANGTWNERCEIWEVPCISLTIVCHFLAADLLRMFGRDFYCGLLARTSTDLPAVGIRDGKLLGFADFGRPFSAPCVEFATMPDGSVFGVRLQMRDTALPFGPGSLDRHSRTFVGLGKCESLTGDDKADMLETFRRKSSDAFGYAIVDAIDTLVVWEQMRSQDRRTYKSFGWVAGELPPMKPTLGARVAQFLTNEAWRSSAAGSSELASKAALRRLMTLGGGKRFATDARASRFGEQTGRVHGGLLFSRSPVKLWHEAPAMMRDVDLAGCYNGIIGKINVYFGRAVVLEPGNKGMELRQAVSLMERHADRDAWYLRVTGDVKSLANVLIPSTLGAITPDKYRTRRGNGNRAGEPKGAKLFSQRVESGIVTWATWLMIQALPRAAHREFERLGVDSIVFYPRRFVADNGPDFDRLREELRGHELSWEGILDTDEWAIREKLKIDQDFVSLRFPIGDCAKKIGELRRAAQERHGKGSGADVAWKLQANTMYGVLASLHMPTSNAVAANVITAHARAEAFAMMLSMNGIQVITDGCSYRRDQIPACTFRECLRRQEDYPLRRADAESKIPFFDPAAIPDDGQEFTAWYRAHVMKFFGVAGAEYVELFGTHRLEHKSAGDSGSTAFDALGCDGSGNYLKCQRNPDGTWSVLDAAMRGYRPASKEALKAWIVDTYSNDHISTLAPVTKDTGLLKFRAAKQKVRMAFQRGIDEVVFPLGFAFDGIRNYKVVKPSAFICQTPAQWRAMNRNFEKFNHKTSCGVELLALRRKYGERPPGSIEHLLNEIYELVQAGCTDFTKALNLNRPLAGLETISEDRRLELDLLRLGAEQKLLQTMDTSNAEPDDLLSGLILTKSTCPWS